MGHINKQLVNSLTKQVFCYINLQEPFSLSQDCVNDIIEEVLVSNKRR
jgi:hypothetical protein